MTVRLLPCTALVTSVYHLHIAHEDLKAQFSVHTNVRDVECHTRSKFQYLKNYAQYGLTAEYLVSASTFPYYMGIYWHYVDTLQPVTNATTKHHLI